MAVRLPAEEIRAWLGETPGLRTPLTGLADGYRGFYRHNCAFDQHLMGWIPVHQHKIFVQHYSREGSRGVVVLLHGYLDHSGLQGPTISTLLDLGFSVLALDHAGHGFSTGDRASIDDFSFYVDTVMAVLTRSEQWLSPNQPRIVMGHSLGAAVAMTYMLQHPGSFDGAVLIAPLIHPRRWPLARPLHRIGRQLFRSQRRLWRRNTHDLEYRHFIRHVDPLSPRQIPTAWIDAMVNWIPRFKGLSAVSTPVLVVQGTDDGTVDWRSNLPVIRSKFDPVDVAMVQDGKHQLLNELEDWRAKTWAPIVPFLRQWNGEKEDEKNAASAPRT